MLSYIVQKNMFRICILFLAVTPLVLTQTVSSTCGDGQWNCYDGSCIPASGKCNGTVECDDSSDESFVTCRGNSCPEDQFRCTYGACVNVTSQCDDKRDCADNSDELLPICRNDVDTNICRERIIDGFSSRKVDCQNSKDTCDNNEVLPYPGRCNGRVDCQDGSDETLATCADAVCVAPLFRCAYGGCAHRKAKCDGVQDCADGSDESDELCSGIIPKGTTTTSRPTCILPPYPDHGRYIVGDFPDAVPGQSIADKVVFLTVSCDPDYNVDGSSTLFCFNGAWSADFPRCVRFCKLAKHPSVDYRCVVNGDDATTATRECGPAEPDGSTVEPRCVEPLYYYPGVLHFMHCVNGSWDNIVICTPDCGKSTPVGDQLVYGGKVAVSREVPWHVGIYKRRNMTHICGGSIVSNNVVLSAASCFWGGVSLLPARRFMVAAGTLHRTWKHPDDVDGQFSDVTEIKVPARFQGSLTNYQEDIALVVLTLPFQYSVFVRPICLNFDYGFDSEQLQNGKLAKVAGWGHTESGESSDLLLVTELPYIPVDKCIADAPQEYKQYITSDKICAGGKNDTGLCHGDSGAGLAFPALERGGQRHFLRGVASANVGSAGQCLPRTVTAFTRLASHEQFIQEYL